MILTIDNELDQKIYKEIIGIQSGKIDDMDSLYNLSVEYVRKLINDVVADETIVNEVIELVYPKIYNCIVNEKIDPIEFYEIAGRLTTYETHLYLRTERADLLEIEDDINTNDADSEITFDFCREDRTPMIPAALLYDERKRGEIAKILKNISIEQKLVLQYFYYENMSVVDIAKAMDCKKNTVREHIRYIRNMVSHVSERMEKDNRSKRVGYGELAIFWLIFCDEYKEENMSNQKVVEKTSSKDIGKTMPVREEKPVIVPTVPVRRENEDKDKEKEKATVEEKKAEPETKSEIKLEKTVQMTEEVNNDIADIKTVKMVIPATEHVEDEAKQKTSKSTELNVPKESNKPKEEHKEPDYIAEQFRKKREEEKSNIDASKTTRKEKKPNYIVGVIVAIAAFAAIIGIMVIVNNEIDNNKFKERTEEIQRCANKGNYIEAYDEITLLSAEVKTTLGIVDADDIDDLSKSDKNKYFKRLDGINTTRNGIKETLKGEIGNYSTSNIRKISIDEEMQKSPYSTLYWGALAEKCRNDSNYVMYYVIRAYISEVERSLDGEYDYDQMISYLERAQSLCEAYPDDDSKLESEQSLMWLLYGKLYMNHGEFYAAVECFERSDKPKASDLCLEAKYRLLTEDPEFNIDINNWYYDELLEIGYIDKKDFKKRDGFYYLKEE